MNQFRIPIKTVWILAGLCLTACLFAKPVTAGIDTPLWLSLAPLPAAPGPDCCEAPAAMAGRPERVTPNGRPGGKPGGMTAIHESEHRPLPMRTYWLNSGNLQPDAKAYVRHPDGSFDELAIESRDNGLCVTLSTPMGDGPYHGANTVYVVEKSVKDGVLTVRVAQWLTIHHSCGWGHDHKFDPERLTAAPLPQVPFQIVLAGLWDGNFHSHVMSGETLSVMALHDSQPAAGARISLTTEKQWTKTLRTNPDGSATFQLIRDYYPANWDVFDRERKNSFKLSATYETTEHGEYAGLPYQQVRYIATFPWRYYPSRTEYSSLGAGLALGTVFMVGGGAGFYTYRQRRQQPYRGIVLDE